MAGCNCQFSIPIRHGFKSFSMVRFAITILEWNNSPEQTPLRTGIAVGENIWDSV